MAMLLAAVLGVLSVGCAAEEALTPKVRAMPSPLLDEESDAEPGWGWGAGLSGNDTECPQTCVETTVETMRGSGFYLYLGHTYSQHMKYNESSGGTLSSSCEVWSTPCYTNFQTQTYCTSQKVDATLRSNHWIRALFTTYRATSSGDYWTCGSMPHNHGGGGTQVDRVKDSLCWEVWLVFPDGHETYMGDWCRLAS